MKIAEDKLTIKVLANVNQKQIDENFGKLNKAFENLQERIGKINSQMKNLMPDAGELNLKGIKEMDTMLGNINKNLEGISGFYRGKLGSAITDVITPHAAEAWATKDLIGKMPLGETAAEAAKKFNIDEEQFKDFVKQQDVKRKDGTKWLRGQAFASKQAVIEALKGYSKMLSRDPGVWADVGKEKRRMEKYLGSAVDAPKGKAGDAGPMMVQAGQVQAKLGPGQIQLIVPPNRIDATTAGTTDAHKVLPREMTSAAAAAPVASFAIPKEFTRILQSNADTMAAMLQSTKKLNEMLPKLTDTMRRHSESQVKESGKRTHQTQKETQATEKQTLAEKKQAQAQEKVDRRKTPESPSVSDEFAGMRPSPTGEGIDQKSLKKQAPSWDPVKQVKETRDEFGQVLSKEITTLKGRGQEITRKFFMTEEGPSYIDTLVDKKQQDARERFVDQWNKILGSYGTKFAKATTAAQTSRIAEQFATELTKYANVGGKAQKLLGRDFVSKYKREADKARKEAMKFSKAAHHESMRDLLAQATGDFDREKEAVGGRRTPQARQRLLEALGVLRGRLKELDKEKDLPQGMRRLIGNRLQKIEGQIENIKQGQIEAAEKSMAKEKQRDEKRAEAREKQFSRAAALSEEQQRAQSRLDQLIQQGYTVKQITKLKDATTKMELQGKDEQDMPYGGKGKPFAVINVARGEVEEKLRRVEEPKSKRQYRESTRDNVTLGSNLIGNIGRVTGWAAAVGVLYGSLYLARNAVMSLARTDKQVARLDQVFRGSAESAGELGEKTGKIKSETYELANDVLYLASAQGQAAESAMEAAISWSRLGLNMIEVKEATRVSLMAANIAEISPLEATEHLAAIMQSFKLEVSELATTLGVLNEVSNKYRATNKDMLTGIARTGSVAKHTGLELNELIAVIGTAVGTTGQSGANIGNAIKTLATKLGNPLLQEKVRVQFGIDMRTTEADLINMGDLLTNIFIAYEQMNRAQRGSFLYQVGGAFQSARLAAVMDSYVKALELAVTAQLNINSAEEENTKIRQTLLSQTRALITEAERFAHSIGQNPLVRYPIEMGIQGLKNVMTVASGPMGMVGMLLAGATALMGLQAGRTVYGKRKAEGLRRMDEAKASGEQANLTDLGFLVQTGIGLTMFKESIKQGASENLKTFMKKKAAKGLGKTMMEAMTFGLFFGDAKTPEVTLPQADDGSTLVATAGDAGKKPTTKAKPKLPFKARAIGALSGIAALLATSVPQALAIAGVVTAALALFNKLVESITAVSESTQREIQERGEAIEKAKSDAGAAASASRLFKAVGETTLSENSLERRLDHLEKAADAADRLWENEKGVSDELREQIKIMEETGDARGARAEMQNLQDKSVTETLNKRSEAYRKQILQTQTQRAEVERLEEIWERVGQFEDFWSFSGWAFWRDWKGFLESLVTSISKEDITAAIDQLNYLSKQEDTLASRADEISEEISKLYSAIRSQATGAVDQAGFFGAIKSDSAVINSLTRILDLKQQLLEIDQQVIDANKEIMRIEDEQSKKRLMLLQKKQQEQMEQLQIQQKENQLTPEEEKKRYVEERIKQYEELTAVWNKTTSEHGEAKLVRLLAEEEFNQFPKSLPEETPWEGFLKVPLRHYGFIPDTMDERIDAFLAERKEKRDQLMEAFKYEGEKREVQEKAFQNYIEHWWKFAEIKTEGGKSIREMELEKARKDGVKAAREWLDARERFTKAWKEYAEAVKEPDRARTFLDRYLYNLKSNKEFLFDNRWENWEKVDRGVKGAIGDEQYKKFDPENVMVDHKFRQAVRATQEKQSAQLSFDVAVGKIESLSRPIFPEPPPLADLMKTHPLATPQPVLPQVDAAMLAKEATYTDLIDAKKKAMIEYAQAIEEVKGIQKEVHEFRGPTIPNKMRTAMIEVVAEMEKKKKELDEARAAAASFERTHPDIVAQEERKRAVSKLEEDIRNEMYKVIGGLANNVRQDEFSRKATLMGATFRGVGVGTESERLVAQHRYASSNVNRLLDIADPLRNANRAGMRSFNPQQYQRAIQSGISPVLASILTGQTGRDLSQDELFEMTQHMSHMKQTEISLQTKLIDLKAEEARITHDINEKTRDGNDLIGKGAEGILRRVSALNAVRMGFDDMPQIFGFDSGLQSEIESLSPKLNPQLKDNREDQATLEKYLKKTQGSMDTLWTQIRALIKKSSTDTSALGKKQTEASEKLMIAFESVGTSAAGAAKEMMGLKEQTRNLRDAINVILSGVQSHKAYSNTSAAAQNP